MHPSPTSHPVRTLSTSAAAFSAYLPLDCTLCAGVRFAMFSTRPSIDALGYPMWGYDSTHKKAGWQTKEDYPEAEIGWKVPELYPEMYLPSGARTKNSREPARKSSPS